MSTYEIFRQWCIDHDKIPPSRKWWEMAVGPVAIDDVQFDIETERREGWGYDSI